MGKTCGIGKMTQRTTTKPKIRYLGSEIIEIHKIQYRAPRRQEKARSCVVKGSKAKKGASKGSMTRAEIKVKSSNNKFIT